MIRPANPASSTTSAPAPSAVRSLGHVIDVEAGVVRGFAKAVADRMCDGPLTLAERDRLLGRAERLGLKRFDANLIVAAVEQNVRSKPGWIKIAFSQEAPPRRARWFAPASLAPASLALALQALIAVGAWWLLSW